MPSESKISKRKANTAQKKYDALELRKAGATYRQIAEQLGISVGSAINYVDKALASLRSETVQEAEKVRAIELERLDTMQLALWRMVKNGNTGAIDRIIKIMERRSKLLGIDMPTKHALDIDVTTLSDEELDAIINSEE